MTSQITPEKIYLELSKLNSEIKSVSSTNQKHYELLQISFSKDLDAIRVSIMRALNYAHDANSLSISCATTTKALDEKCKNLELIVNKIESKLDRDSEKLEEQKQATVKERRTNFRRLLTTIIGGISLASIFGIIELFRTHVINN